MSHTVGKIQQNDRQPNNLSQVDRDSLKPEQSPRLAMPISDVDYEFLFNQLLEGIAHGWHDRRIVKFFACLGDRANQADWVAWLERLEEKASVLPLQSKRQLGTMMIRLGELTRSTTEADKIGAASHRIGRELLFSKINFVWEYVGPDLSLEGDRSKQELSERLPSDFNALGSEWAIEETEASPEFPNQPAAQSRLNSIEEKNIQESATLLWEYVGPDLSLEGDRSKQELSERLPSDFNALGSERAIEKTKEFPEFQNQPAAESRLNSIEEKNIQESESPASTAIPDELTADLVDFPESIPQTKQTNPKSSLSSSKQQKESKIETSGSDPDLTEINLNKDEPQIASSMPTESEIEALDISQVMNLIQEDEELARQISQKLNSAIAPSQNTVSQLDRSSLELIESWFNLGLKQVSVGEFSKAIVSWEKALSINPNLSEAWHNRGSALGRLGDYRGAIKSFQNALAIDPDNYQAWNDRAHALYQLQNWKGAADSWSNAIKIMPGNHLFWYNRGCALEQLERWDEAIASHEKALEIVPNFQPGRSRYINLIADTSRSN